VAGIVRFDGPKRSSQTTRFQAAGELVEGVNRNAQSDFADGIFPVIFPLLQTISEIRQNRKKPTCRHQSEPTTSSRQFRLTRGCAGGKLHSRAMTAEAIARPPGEPDR